MFPSQKPKAKNIYVYKVKQQNHRIHYFTQEPYRYHLLQENIFQTFTQFYIAIHPYYKKKFCGA